MGKRKILGLIYGYDEGWIAGSYYIENLIACLLLLPLNERPIIKVYVFEENSQKSLINKGFSNEINIILIKDGQSVIDRFINKVSYWLTGKYLIVRGFDQKVDAIFPNPNTFHFHRMKNPIFWIPDFQDKYFSEFFSTEEINKRQKNHVKIARNKKNNLILSSQSALNDYTYFYPYQQSQNFIIPFAVTIPSLSGIDRKAVLDKYKLNSHFFICSNQFWAHKGHKTLLNAIENVKSMGYHIKVVFTGETRDNRNPDFFTQLQSMIGDLDISNSVHFLGFIPREDQLVLMKESLAIVQPSQFEGWSTVVEDAKVLNKSIIVSDLQVHKEQLKEDYNGFFKVNDINSLSIKLIDGIKENINTPDFNYVDIQKNFGKRVKTILENVS